MLEKIKKNWWIVLAGLLIIPYFAFLNMQERKAKELNASTHQLDERISGLALTVDRDGIMVTYLNGTKLPADGIGLVTVTLEDYQADPERIKRQGMEVKDDDFPLVVFFNQSGFDATGDPVAVRRAKDGTRLFGLAKQVARVRVLQVLRGGGFYVWDGGERRKITEEEFYRDFMGIEPPTPTQNPEQLDKLTDAELAKRGLKRLPKEVEKTEKGVPADTLNKTGLRGTVVRIGGVPALQAVEGAFLVVLKGKYEPPPEKLKTAAEALEKVKDRIASVGRTDADGVYAFALPPGVYTLLMVAGESLRGNAVKDGAYPTVEVKDGWQEYDFRLPAR